MRTDILWGSVRKRWFVVLVFALLLHPPLARALSPVDVFRLARPAVVEVYTRDADAQLVPFGYGSGVVVAAFQVVTNCHVLDNASTVEIIQAGTTLPATLEHRDQRRDLCVLRVPAMTAAAVTQRSIRALVVGETVYALGNVMGLGISLSEGLISALPEQGNMRSIQTTALMAPGSSGGGLFDAEGKLIGITIFQESEGQNINFASPTDCLSEIPERAPGPLEAASEETSLHWQQKAISLENAQNWAELRDHAQRWVAATPESGAAFFALALAQHALEQYREAIQAYETAVRLQPNHVRAWGALSMAYTALEQWDQALEAGMTATRRGAHTAIGWVALGQVYIQQQQVEKAVEAFTQATRVDPNDLRAWRVLGKFYVAINRLDSAVVALQRVVDLQPDVAANWLSLGTAFVELGKPQQALKALRQARAIAPDMARIHFMLGYAYVHLKQPRKALEMMHLELRAQSEPTTQAQVWEMIGHIYQTPRKTPSLRAEIEEV